ASVDPRVARLLARMRHADRWHVLHGHRLPAALVVSAARIERGPPDEPAAHAGLRLAGARRSGGALPLERVHLFPGRHARARGRDPLDGRDLRHAVADGPAHRAAHRRAGETARAARTHALIVLPDRLRL